MIFDESGYMRAWTYDNLPAPFVLNIPTGTYDIITEFQPNNASGRSHVVIKELQDIQVDMTLQFNSAEAVNYVSTTAYNENGAILQPEEGAGGYLFFKRLLYFNPSSLVALGDYYFLVDPFTGQGPEWNFYINDVSPRYSVIQTLHGNGFEVGTYFSKFETVTGIDGSLSIANNPAAWSYHTELFQTTQLGDYTIAPAYYIASTYNGNLLTGWETSSGGTINAGDEPFRGFLNNPMDGNPADLFIIPAIIDAYVSYSPTTGGVSYYTKGSPVFSDGSGGILYGSGDLSFNYHSDPNYATKPYVGDDYYVMSNGKIQLMPFHPRFTFDKATTPSAILADNVPITVTGFKGNKLTTANKGRYGETRETDYLATQLELKQNGTVIFSGFYEDYTSVNMPSNGEIEIKLTDNNTLVDGLQGINTTTITYNATAGDAPPTLQYLQLRNSEDEVTSIFESAQGATLRLAAGDFIYMQNGADRGYYMYESGTNVTLSFSPHNQNDWTDVAMTEHPEYFQMPAFGDYFEASLSGIQNQNDNAWYDLKVICTDADGNVQQQVISPAFKINDTVLGFESIRESNLMMYPIPFSEQLNVTLPESIKGNYTFKVTDLLGRAVYSRNQSEKTFSWKSPYLSSGVYIISIENNGKSLTKKVVKM